MLLERHFCRCVAGVNVGTHITERLRHLGVGGARTVQEGGRETSLRELGALIMSGHVHGNGWL